MQKQKLLLEYYFLYFDIELYYSNKPNLDGLMLWYIPDCMNVCLHPVCLPASIDHSSVSIQTIYIAAFLCHLSVCLSVQLSIHPLCLYICLPSQNAHLYFKGPFFCLSSHTAAWRHQSWAGTLGSMAQSQLEPLPVWVDNVFPQSGHCGTVGPEESIGGEEEMTVHRYSWGVTDKAGPPSQHTTKKEECTW